MYHSFNHLRLVRHLLLYYIWYKPRTNWRELNHLEWIRVRLDLWRNSKPFLSTPFNHLKPGASIKRSHTQSSNSLSLINHSICSNILTSNDPFAINNPFTINMCNIFLVKDICVIIFLNSYIYMQKLWKLRKQFPDANYVRL